MRSHLKCQRCGFLYDNPLTPYIICANSEFNLFIFIVFDLGFTARQYYFTHFELSQSLGCGGGGVAKTGVPQEKPSDHPQAELGLSHMLPELGSNLQR